MYSTVQFLEPVVFDVFELVLGTIQLVASGDIEDWSQGWLVSGVASVRGG